MTTEAGVTGHLIEEGIQAINDANRKQMDLVIKFKRGTYLTVSCRDFRATRDGLTVAGLGFYSISQIEDVFIIERKVTPMK